MYRFALSILVLSLVACAAAPKQPRCPTEARTAGEPEHRLRGVCAGMSLVVVPEKGTFQHGVDPVETHRFALLSRAFRAAVAKANPELSGAAYKVRRQGQSAILNIVAAGPTEADALRVCEVLGGVALAHDDAGSMGDDAAKSWLAEQAKSLQRRKDATDRRLHEFRKANNFLAIDLPDRMSLLRSRLMELIKARDRVTRGRRRAALDQAIDAAKTEALEMNRVELEYSRLKRAADSAAKMLALVRERQSGLGLGRLRNRRVRLLDRCAPADCG